MKNFITFLVGFFILYFSNLNAGANLVSFTASSEDNKVIVVWETREEVNLKHFILMRSDINGNFIDYATIQPKGNYSNYQFVDDNLLKPNGNLYNYKLKIVDNNGTVSYSSKISVSASSISSVKRTWGSIKALFR